MHECSQGNAPKCTQGTMNTSHLNLGDPCFSTKGHGNTGRTCRGTMHCALVLTWKGHDASCPYNPHLFAIFQ